MRRDCQTKPPWGEPYCSQNTFKILLRFFFFQCAALEGTVSSWAVPGGLAEGSLPSTGCVPSSAELWPAPPGLAMLPSAESSREIAALVDLLHVGASICTYLTISFGPTGHYGHGGKSRFLWMQVQFSMQLLVQFHLASCFVSIRAGGVLLLQGGHEDMYFSACRRSVGKLLHLCLKNPLF